MIEKTAQEYRDVIARCKSLFENKTRDYGTAWRILRLPSITDQIYIKAQRIRSIQEKGTQKVEDSIKDEFVGIINYCVMALMQAELRDASDVEMTFDQLEPLYDRIVNDTFDLLQNKNHDYGEAWRGMRVTSITDIILMKLLRVKQIEDNKGRTLVSEGVRANYQDMINYSVFAMILLND
ncbi:MAG TPA: DUF1599 domain-containing protein [Chryseolinea sp.]|nr:DUF1599 domain-containing protein [Chryseolinea sp.]